ncbi:hypothetical protein AB0H51_11450 [Streptomyces griseoluteus]|uniref:hypothetical protein n=1 Tax=Streptomyces griseoluteus TaxID=29306 RepID=UPI00340DF8AE
MGHGIDQPPEQPSPTRRLIATGTRLRLGTRTITVRATLAGVTGTIRTHAAIDQAAKARVAELHRACRADYQAAAPSRAKVDHVVGAILLAAAGFRSYGGGR